MELKKLSDARQAEAIHIVTSTLAAHARNGFPIRKYKWIIYDQLGHCEVTMTFPDS